MGQEIEIEFKNLLTQKEYHRLLNQIPFPAYSDTQTNYYFETKDLALQELGCALRIREKNGYYRLTLKEPHEHGLLETHDFLTKNEALQSINGTILKKEDTATQLEQLGISVDSLVCYGSLSTERREVQREDILLVLDYSTYNGKSDYELELEATSTENGKAKFNELLSKYKIPKRETPNKIKRFFTSL
ncbi:MULTISPECIES: CYTH domain-containing protein [Virgibacillus]|uniref:CYTH domain-containing protein n=2 Tax=Virgibacillus TaxID=84406 RepID=A0A024QDL3_9BACI|nr:MULTISPECIES: CYTH domain-containing protein [Virgibacillus]EQB35204.1 hypothetical protein M948_19075 [Virgibacillus sp. CM-4]MYL42741.1 CYTH domain-containing protein [Virgibacillus massiliensis]GGJ69081.1 CYTH domain-containing protein [Virgibacillus kapii]CDQ40633.1 hypothetical protein BN990_02959 [Virgibacillus massiliensis]